jgi:chromosome transmission fidelity protein 1
LIIDEAHNIIEAMIDCYSASVTKAQIEAALNAIILYHKRFAKKVGAHSALYFEHIIQILTAFLNFMKNRGNSAGSINIGEFLIDTKTEKFDFYKILAFCEEFEFSRKVVGQNEKSGNRGSVIGINSAFEFLRALSDDISAGKIFINQNEEQSLRYYLMNPKRKFAELTELTKCLILAGGTMEPRAEYLELFSEIPNNRIKLFSCSHIISPDNLLMAVVGRGESGLELKFTYENRDNSKMTEDLHKLLLQVCLNVPNGIVVFVPSYFFLTKLKNSLEKSGTAEKISKKKKVFFDNKDENLLENFCRAAENFGGILFAVVRGKLSEGINFSDRLGRCVIMIGLPYLNRNDVEIQERMRYLDSNNREFNGRMFYESSCHKAINQSIGRAIRHRLDYAVVLLVDQRYSSCFDKRPSWMMRNIAKPNEDLFAKVRDFFRFHENQTRSHNK